MWSGQDGDIRFTAAGGWYLLISGPMFQIILFLWFWRFLIWAAFLFRISRLSLRPRPTDPDLVGGLGYLVPVGQVEAYKIQASCEDTYS